MKHIFYFLAFFAILFEGAAIMNIKKVHEFSKSLKAKNKDTYTDTDKTYMFLMFGYGLWCLIGFFTSQWLLFVSLFLLSFIPKKWIIINWIDSFISLLILIFIVLNAYHFKIDIWQLIIR